MVSENNTRVENDPAYESLGQNPPEKWCQRKENFLSLHYWIFFYRGERILVASFLWRARNTSLAGNERSEEDSGKKYIRLALVPLLASSCCN